MAKGCRIALEESVSDRKSWAGLQRHAYVQVWVSPLLMAWTRITGHRRYNHGDDHVHLGFLPAAFPFFSCHSVHELSKPGQHI